MQGPSPHGPGSIRQQMQIQHPTLEWSQPVQPQLKGGVVLLQKCAGERGSPSASRIAAFFQAGSTLSRMRLRKKSWPAFEASSRHVAPA